MFDMLLNDQLFYDKPASQLCTIRSSYFERYFKSYHTIVLIIIAKEVALTSFIISPGQKSPIGYLDTQLIY